MKKISYILTLIVILALFISSSNGESVCSWICYGGNIGHTSEIDNQCIPNEKLTILHKREFDEKLVCHPVLYDNSVYLVTEGGKLISQDATTGEIIWEQSELSTRVEFAPFVNSDSVYQASGNDVIKLSRKTGKISHTYKADSRITAPQQQDDDIFVGLRDGTLVCLDANNLENKWSFKTDKSIVSIPSVCDGKVFIGSTDKKLYCLNQENGEKLWSFVCESMITTPIVISDDKVYAISGSSLFAFDLDGTARWKYQTYADVTSVGIVDNKVVCTTSNFRIQCLDGTFCGGTCCIKPAKELWYALVGKGKMSVLNISDKRILVCCESDEIVSIDIETGKTEWSEDLGYDLDKTIICSNRIFVADGNEFIVFAQKPNKLTYTIGSNSYTRDKYNVTMDSKPEIIHSRTFLPARYVVEPIGGDIKWDQYLKQITIDLDDKEIVLTVGKSVALVNGVEQQISDDVSVTPVIVNGRTLVPLRFIAENLGCDVEYISKTKEVILTAK